MRDEGLARQVSRGAESSAHAVIAGRWEWLKVGAGLAVLLGVVGWLTFESVWAVVVGAVLGVALGRLLVARETLTLEPDALVSRAHGRTVRLRLASISGISRTPVPYGDHHLQIEGARAGDVIIIPSAPLVDAVCRELGRRPEHRRAHIRVEEGAAGWLGWSLPVDHEAIAARRHPVQVVVGSERPPGPTYQRVLEVLEDRAVQAVVGTRTIAREDTAGWAAFARQAPVSEQTRILSGLGDTLAVFSPTRGVIDAMLTDAEEASLARTLPEGARLVQSPNRASPLAVRTVTGWLRVLVGREPGATRATRSSTPGT